MVGGGELYLVRVGRANGRVCMVVYLRAGGCSGVQGCVWPYGRTGGGGEGMGDSYGREGVWPDVRICVRAGGGEAWGWHGLRWGSRGEFVAPTRFRTFGRSDIRTFGRGLGRGWGKAVGLG